MRVFFLLLPALIPSWRFFKTVEPSPRVQWTFVRDGQRTWKEYYPRPQSISFGRMLRRLIWNPAWNDALYLTSLAERQTIEPSSHSYSEIDGRVRRRLHECGVASGTTYQFRILFVHRDGPTLRQAVTYEGPIIQMPEASLDV